MNITQRLLLFLLLALGFLACKSNASDSGARANDNSAPEDSAKATKEPAVDAAEADKQEDPFIDREYPGFEATFDGKPVEIRAAIAIIDQVSNTANTVEGSRRVLLFTTPTNCERGKKNFARKGFRDAYIVYQFQSGGATISKTGGGEPAGGMSSGGSVEIDFSKVDPTFGAESTVYIEGGDEPMEGMRGNPWSVKGTITLKGCGEWKSGLKGQ